MFIRTFNVLRILARSFEVRLLAFGRTGTGAIRDPKSMAAACEALGEFAEVTVVQVPQDASRVRFVWDHLRSAALGQVFTHYRHDNPGFARLLRRDLAAGRFDIIHVDSLDLARFLPLLPVERLALTHHNVESQLLLDRARREKSPVLRAYVLQQAKLQERCERYWCPRVRVNVTVSDRDAGELKSIAPGSRTITVPNGVDVRKIQPGNGDSGDIVCVGGLGWFPNHDALDFFCEEILPHLEGLAPDRIRWVGRATEEQIAEYASRYGIRLTGYVDSVLPHVQDASCYILPYRLGGGTRLKLLEALAAGKAIVSTSIGAMGVPAANGDQMLIADEPEAFAAAIRRIMSDSDLREKLGRSARLLAEETYDWETIGERMTALYGRMIC